METLRKLSHVDEGIRCVLNSNVFTYGIGMIMYCVYVVCSRILHSHIFPEFAQISFLLRYLIINRYTHFINAAASCTHWAQKSSKLNIQKEINHAVFSEQLYYPDVELITSAPFLHFNFSTFQILMSSSITSVSFCSVMDPWTLVYSTCKHNTITH
jgi:hypothetical protein